VTPAKVQPALTPVPPPPACTDNWQGGTGNWNDPNPANWSEGHIPGGDDVACITAPGTYTVTFAGYGGSVPLILGGSSGTQTLAITAGGQDCWTSSEICGSAGEYATDSGFQAGSSWYPTSPSIIEPNGVVKLTATPPLAGPAVNGGAAMFGSELTTGPPIFNLGTIVSDPTDFVVNPRQLGYINLDNEGTVAIKAPTSGHGTYINEGNFSIAAAGVFSYGANGDNFTNLSGNIANSGQMGPFGGNGFTEVNGTTTGLPLLSTGWLNFTGPGNSTFDVQGGTLTGNMVPGQSVLVDANSVMNVTNVSYPGPATMNGNLEFINTGGGSPSDAVLNANNTQADQLTIGPAGTMTVNAPGAGIGLTGYVDNQGTFTVDTGLNNQTVFTNEGTFIVNPGGVSSSGNNGDLFTNQSGTITNNGVMGPFGGNGFTEVNGTTTGTPLFSNGPLNFTGTGASSFDVQAGTITGDMVSGQTVYLDANSAHDSAVYQVPASMGGTISELNTGGTPGSSFVLNVGGNAVNQLTIAPTGSFNVGAPGMSTGLTGYIANQGTFTVTGPLDNESVFTNEGTFVTTPSGSASSGGNGVNFVNQSGTITNNGSMGPFGGYGFAEINGTTTGNPLLSTGPLNFLGTGSSSFDVRAGTITGDLAAGQTVYADANGATTVANWQGTPTINGVIYLINLGTATPASVAQLSLGSPLTIGSAGRLTFNNADAGYREVQAPSLINNGTLQAMYEPTFYDYISGTY
jgi:hypothetical protein